MSFTYNFVLMLYTGRLKLFTVYPAHKFKIIAIICTFELLASITFYASLKEIANPAIVSFLVNMVPVFVTLMSIPLLNERFNAIEVIGIFVTLGGAFLLSYSGTLSFSGLLVKGAYLTILSSGLAAMGLIIAKKNIKSIDPYLISFTRSGFLSFFYFLVMIITGTSANVSGYALINMSIGSFFGPFLASVLMYTSFKYIEVSKQSLIQNTHGVFVVISAYFYLNILPTISQLTGGVITIAGVTILILGKLYYKKLHKYFYPNR